MIKNLVLKNFRCFKEFEISDLKTVTLLSGQNNSGKSSILEGIFLALDYAAPDAFASLNGLRGILFDLRPDDLWDPLFHNLLTEDKEGIKLELKIDDDYLKLNYTRDDNFIPVAAPNTESDMLYKLIASSQRSYSLKFDFSFGDFSESGHFIMGSQGILRQREKITNQRLNLKLPSAHYIHSSRTVNNNMISELFSAVTIANKKDTLINTLKIIDDSIVDITTQVRGSQSQLYANANGQWLPLRLAGDGFDHLILIVSSIIAKPSSILLIDEIEAGFHYSVYDKIWKVLMSAAKENNCQIIASTHSYECLESAVNQAKNADDFCYFRLDRNKEKDSIAAYRFSHDTLINATNSNLEVR